MRAHLSACPLAYQISSGEFPKNDHVKHDKSTPFILVLKDHPMLRTDFEDFWLQTFK